MPYKNFLVFGAVKDKLLYVFIQIAERNCQLEVVSVRECLENTVEVCLCSCFPRREGGQRRVADLIPRRLGARMGRT